MAVVFSAYQPVFDRKVAAKVLTDAADDTWKRLRREAQAMRILSGHPHIVPVYDVGQTDDGRPYLLMPLYTRGALDGLINRRGELSTDEVLRCGVQLASALASAHAVGVVHGDVKPSNILLTGQHDVVLTDFGVARIAHRADSTVTGVVVGTVSYASPEILNGQRSSPATDVYALAGTLITAGSGQAPFYRPDDDESLVPMLLRIVQGDAHIGEQISGPLRDLLERGIATDPGDRPTAAEMGEELQSIQRLLGLPVTKMASIGTTVSAHPTSSTVVGSGLVTGPITAVPPPPGRDLLPGVAGPPSPDEAIAPPDGSSAADPDPTAPTEAPTGGTEESPSPPAEAEHAPRSLTTLAADRPTRRDSLHRSPLVQGLASVLDDPGTSLPMTIGIFGQWGSGKSSLMLQLEQALTTSARPESSKHWTPIWFDAWRYQSRDRMWAGLARAIYLQGTEAQGSLARRLRFRVDLERRRKGAAALVAAAILGFVAVLWLVASVIQAMTTTGWSPLAGAVAASGVISLAGAYLGLVSDPYARALSGGSFRRRYDAALGLSDAAERDIGHLVDTLASATPDGAVVVFLDDLDRCDPAVIGEALTTVSELFGHAGDQQIAFVLGVDIDLVESAVEGAMDGVRASLERINPRRTVNLGARYLERIFQLSISLDSFAQPPVEQLLGTTHREQSIDNAAVNAFLGPLLDLDIDRADELTFERRRAGLDTVNIEVSQLAAFRAAIRERRAPLLSGLNRQVREAEHAVVANMRLTPRAVKRFDNTFRLQLQVANSTPGHRLQFTSSELTALAKWTAVRLFYPQLARSLDREIGLWHELESLADMIDSNRRVQERLVSIDSSLTIEVAGDLAPVFGIGLPDAALAELPLDSFSSVV
jgi:serine/threonine protein kinase